MELRDSIAEMSVKYGSVLFPFRVEELLEALPHVGFIVSEHIDPQFHARLTLSGIVATRGGLRVLVDSSRYVVGIRGSDFSEVTQGFADIEDLLRRELDFESERLASFYEIQCQARCRIAKNHLLDSFAKHTASFPLMNDIAGVLSHPVTTFGLHLVAQGVDPNSTDWFDVRLEPDVLSPAEFLIFYMVYRDSDKSKVMAISTRGFGIADELISIGRRGMAG